MSEEMQTARGEELRESMDELRDAVERQLGTRELSRPAAHEGELPPFARDLPDDLDADHEEFLLARVRELEPWLQGPFPLGGGLAIAGAWRNDTRWVGLAPHVPELHGRRVLDVGSNAGYDPFMFKARGAEHVMACEPFDFINQMLFLESLYHTGIDPHRLAWQELDPQVHGTFDLVHCHGVLYHEMHPVALLQRLREMLADDGTLLLGSMMLASVEMAEYARFVPGSYFGDPTWWWVPGRLALRWMIEAVGFEIEEEFGLSDGPRGEFATVNGYFKARKAELSPGVTHVSPPAG